MEQTKQISLCKFNAEDEVWKKVEEFPWLQISSYGRLKNLQTNKILKGRFNKDGYIIYCIYSKQDGKHYFRYAHRLTALAFLEKPEGIKNVVVDHINRDKTDNSLKNIRWATRRENRINSDEDKTIFLKHKSTPISLFDKNGEFVRDFKSVEEASIIMNRSKQEIARNIHKKRIPFKFGYFEVKNLK